jgi:hypothetical protein|tara:strand:+ start:58 stop:303 length:246 start_codon:yes stop_codon:yes gene_type:complete
MIDPNKLKKGVRGVLKNGSRFIFQDNRRGNIRLVQVEGVMTVEIGSIYLKDIDYVEIGGDAVKIDLSRYEKINKTIKNLGL